MGRLKDLDAELHELPDYEKGIQAERQRILDILESEKTRTGLGFIQYKTLLQKIGE
jgi:hypothetical protein